MQAIKDIFRIGRGPSSSHTIAPKRAADLFKQVYGPQDRYEVDLYGSLALTGRGHKTDEIIMQALDGKAVINFKKDLSVAENLFVIRGYKGANETAVWHIKSLGGGAIKIEEYDSGDEREVYPHNTFDEVKKYLQSKDISILDYLLEYEPNILEYLDGCFDVMITSVERGLKKEGILSEKLNVYRSAKDLYREGLSKSDIDLKRMAYAYAAGEENADGQYVCTAPTLGSCGVVASFVYSSYKDDNFIRSEIVKALAVGGLFANIIKTNATISGAMGGCQAEIGTACALAASAIAFLRGGDTYVVEYAAEIGIEHHLGLTCDPVMGMVIIPCIERNAMAILRSYDAALLALNISKYHTHNVSFDMVVNSMNYTGKKISPELKETSLGGLALEFKKDEN